MIFVTVGVLIQVLFIFQETVKNKSNYLPAITTYNILILLYDF